MKLEENWPRGFREVGRTGVWTDDGRQVITIAHTEQNPDCLTRIVLFIIICSFSFYRGPHGGLAIICSHPL